MLPETISDFTLEQYLLDELPGPERDRVKNLLAADGTLRKRLAVLEEDNRRFAEQSSSSIILNRIKPRSGTWVRFAAPIGVAAALVLLVPMVLPHTGGSDTRIKGGSTRGPAPDVRPGPLENTTGLSVFILHGDKSSALADGAVVHQGDRVQVALNAGKNRRALLLSIDGGGHLTLHAPDSLTSALIEADTPKLLPFAYQLDDAPFFERFVLITATETFDAPTVWKQIEAQTKAWLPTHPGEPPVLKLDQGLSLTTFDLRKSFEVKS